MCQTITERETNQFVHPFQRAGLGIAPFVFDGMTENVIRHQDGTTQNGGSCDYYYTGIRYECWVRSADGKRFKVGNDCIEKLGRDDNRLVTQAEAARRAIDKRNRDAATAAKKIKEKARIAAAFALLESDEAIRSALASKPHPSIKSEDFSLLSYCEWMAVNAGHAGKFAVAKLVEKSTS